jgi:hypothetical protein
MEERLENELIQAIHEQRLDDAVDSFLDAGSRAGSEGDQLLLQEIMATCRAVTETCVAEGNRLMGLMKPAGIDASFDAEAAAAKKRCFYLIELNVPRSDALSAVRLAQDQGYMPSIPMNGAAWEVLRRFCSQTTLVKSDDLTMRLVIRWREAPARGRFDRIITPTPEDAAMLRLPASFWPVAFAVRPLRILFRRLGPGTGTKTQAPYVGTPDDAISPLLDFASLSENDRLVDLGCGDGRIVIAAAEQFGCQARGYENNVQLAAMARRNASSSEASALVTICEEDLSRADLGSVTVVFLFMPASAMAPLISRILQQVRPGTRLIAHEQEPLMETPQPERSQLIVTPSIITVAHLWTKKPDRSP